MLRNLPKHISSALLCRKGLTIWHRSVHVFLHVSMLELEFSRTGRNGATSSQDDIDEFNAELESLFGQRPAAAPTAGQVTLLWLFLSNAMLTAISSTGICVFV